MSWDVVVFNLNKRVESVDDIKEDVLMDIGTPTEFKKILQEHFGSVVWEDTRGKIETPEYALELSISDDNETFSNTIFHLYGEKAIYALIDLCNENHWQAFDTGLGQMLDLDHPEKNGYKNFQEYLAFILKNGG